VDIWIGVCATDCALNAAIVSTLDFNKLPTTGYTIVKRGPISALPQPKTGVTINEQHDYITVRAVFADGSVNMTWSWNGERVSGRGIDSTAMRVVIRSMKIEETSSAKLKSEAVRDLASKFASVKQFVAALA
jgi:hypothetical protein